MEMSNAEIRRLCGEAMEPMPFLPGESEIWGVEVRYSLIWVRDSYNPLTNDAQLIALGKAHPKLFRDCVDEWERSGGDLNRIFCVAVANVQKAKVGKLGAQEAV